LSGSHGSGHLYGVANWANGTWDFSRLVFESESNRSSGKIDLTPVRRLQLPSVPAKNVYLLPIGMAEGESLQWAPAYYKAKLGIDVKVLAPIPLDPKLIDAQSIEHRQVDRIRGAEVSRNFARTRVDLDWRDRQRYVHPRF